MISIKIGKGYEISKDKYQWILTRFTYGKSKKTGEETTNTYQTYHSNLDQCVQELSILLGKEVEKNE